MLKATQLTFNPNFVNEMCILRSTSTFVEHSSCRTDVIHVTFPHVLYILGKMYILGIFCWDEITIEKCCEHLFCGFYEGRWISIRVTHSPEYLEKGSALLYSIMIMMIHLIFCSPKLPRSVTGLRHSHNTPEAASADASDGCSSWNETYQLFQMDGETLEETQNMERLP